MTATLHDAGPDQCVIALGPRRVTYSRRAVERVLKWVDLETPGAEAVRLGEHVVPVVLLRIAAEEMGQA